MQHDSNPDVEEFWGFYSSEAKAKQLQQVLQATFGTNQFQHFTFSDHWSNPRMGQHRQINARPDWASCFQQS